MAKMNGVYTSMKGKLGGGVLQTWKGLQVLRTNAIPANPKSVGQLQQRSNFSQIVECIRPIWETSLKKYWEPFTKNHDSAWNNMMSANLESMKGAAFDPLKLILTKGTLQSAYYFYCDLQEGGNYIRIYHDTIAFINGLPTDWSQGFMYNKKSKKWKVGEFAFPRSNYRTIIYNVLSDINEDMTAFLFFCTRDDLTGKILKVSDSFSSTVPS